MAVSWDFVILGVVEACTLWVRNDRGARDDVKEGTAAERLSPLSGLKAKSARVLGDCGLPHQAKTSTGALFAMKDNGWDHALKVAADGKGLIGHAGAILLRKAADQTGLTSALSGALKEKRTSPLLDRGISLVSMAAAIALGATSMSDIALLAHLAPLLGAAPSGPTVRRTLDLAGSQRMLDRIARARATARAHAWGLIAAASAGFPWLSVAGKILKGWVVIDMDATLVTAHSDKEGAAPTWKKGYDLLTELAAEAFQFSGHVA